MNWGALFGGIACLAVAGLLAILSWWLPADKMMFMVGGVNVPMVILAVVGVGLLVVAVMRRGGQPGGA